MNISERSRVDRTISQLVDRLESEAAPAARDGLRRLMIAEIDGFASRTERLGLIDQWIVECEARIARALELMNGVSADSSLAGQIRCAVKNLGDLSTFLVSYRTIVELALMR